MKKTLIPFLTFFLVCACFSSCTSLTHKHIPDEEWKYDELSHWRNVTCTWKKCDFNLASEEHIDENYDGICDVCSYPHMSIICP